MKKVGLVFLLNLLVLTLSSCATGGELYVIRSLKNVVFDMSEGMLEEDFCEKYAEFYGEAGKSTKNGDAYIQCEGENGHYAHLNSLTLVYNSPTDVVVLFEENDGIFMYYIVEYYENLILGYTPNIKNDDKFIIIKEDIKNTGR